MHVTHPAGNPDQPAGTSRSHQSRSPSTATMPHVFSMCVSPQDSRFPDFHAAASMFLHPLATGMCGACAKPVSCSNRTVRGYVTGCPPRRSGRLRETPEGPSVRRNTAGRGLCLVCTRLAVVSWALRSASESASKPGVSSIETPIARRQSIDAARLPSAANAVMPAHGCANASNTHRLTLDSVGNALPIPSPGAHPARRMRSADSDAMR